MKEINVPGLGNPDDAQLRRTACTPESHIEQWRKKPVVIEAVQWTGENAGDILFWIGRYHPKGQMAKTAFIDGDTGTLKIKTLESGNGYHIADVGDYIIKGVKNEFYACKPDIFMMTYELNQGEDEAQRQRIVETEDELWGQVRELFLSDFATTKKSAQDTINCIKNLGYAIARK